MMMHIEQVTVLVSYVRVVLCHISSDISGNPVPTTISCVPLL